MFASTSAGISFGKGKSSMVCDYTDDHLQQKVVKAMQHNAIGDMRKMIKHGLNVDAFYRFEGDQEKMTILQYAVKEGSVALVKELLKTACNIEKRTQFDAMTALHFACMCRAPDTAVLLAQMLLDHGAEVNCDNYCRRTPVIVASERGNMRLLRLLLQKHADMSTRCSEEVVPPVIFQTMQTVKMTHRQKAELSDAFRGNDALIQACREQHVDIVGELLERGCSLDVVNDNGNTPLHIAAKSYSRSVYSEQLTRSYVAGNPDIVRLLIDAGCNLDAENCFGCTPASRVVDGLQELAGSSFPIADTVQEVLDLLQTLQMLVCAGCDVNKVYQFEESRQSDTLLGALLSLALPRGCLAAQHMMFRSVQLLLAAGAQLTRTHVACAADAAQSDQLMDLLLEHSDERPSALKQLSRIAIRYRITKPVVATVRKLNMPHAMKSYLTLDTID